MRFKENFAVPVSPSNPYYPLFFHPELSEFKENIANEVSRLEKLNNLQSSKPALAAMELDLGKKEIIKQAKEKHENLIQEVNDVYDAAATKIIENRPNIFETLQPTVAAIIALYNNQSKKGAEAFQRHLEIEKSELLTTNSANSGEVNFKFEDSKIQESLTLKKERNSKWKEKAADLTWTQQTLDNIPSTDILRIIYANGIWVASTMNANNSIFSSEDGKTWVKSNSYKSGLVPYVAYANGMWVVCAREGISKI